MEIVEWKDLYAKNNRPGFREIAAYMGSQAAELFHHFNLTLVERYRFSYVKPSYKEGLGWTYAYGRSGFLLLKDVRFEQGAFGVEGVRVQDETSLEKALAEVERLYQDGYEARFAQFAEERAERRKARAAANKGTAVKEENLNNCVWPAKVKRQDLRRLYVSDAAGVLDTALLDEVGFTLYARCKESREIYDLLEQGKVKCRHCGQVLAYSEIIICPCGQRYTYREYRRSYRADNMPRGEASAVFDRFVEDWEKTRTSQEKMRLIDNLVHEFHVASIRGTPNRPVAVNLIQGTKAQVVQLIEELAYGDIAGSKV